MLDNLLIKFLPPRLLLTSQFIQSATMDAFIQSQSTVTSLDSSLIREQDFDDDSTLSLTQIKSKTRNQEFENGSLHPAFQSPIEKVRLIEIERVSEIIEGGVAFQQPFIGFCVGGKGKKIHINQSKVKRANHFLNDEIPNPFLFSSPHSQATSQQNCKKYDNQGQNFGFGFQQKGQNSGMGFQLGFKAMGTGANICISEQSNAVMTEILKQFSQISKPTKIKRVSGHQTDSNNNFKTVVAAYKNKNSSNLIANRKKPTTPKQKRIINRICSKSLQEDRAQKMQKIGLEDLPTITKQQISQFQQIWYNRQAYEERHKAQKCKERFCYFCDKYEQKEILVNSKQICEEMQAIMSLEEGTRRQLDTLVELTRFKLMRYSYYYPQIVNKKLCPNQVLLEVHKKCLRLERGQMAPLMESLPKVNSKVNGKHLNLCIVGIDYSQEISSCFLELTDGWSSVLAVIPTKNMLYGVIRERKRVSIGSKISIVDWNIHYICNIADYHPRREIRERGLACIQFSFNNSIPIPHNQKLGWPKFPFYRPIHKSKVEGGAIPLLEGLVLRMFTSHKNASFVEVLVQDSKAYLMKVSLQQSVSLVELFRLYYPCQFRRIKKISYNLLEFTSSSRFTEIDDPCRMKKVKQVFKKRLLNTQSGPIAHDLSNPEPVYYDIITSRQNFMFQDHQFQVGQPIQATVLLQQYTIVAVANGFDVCRGERGSCLRRLPKFYDDFQYVGF